MQNTDNNIKNNEETDDLDELDEINEIKKEVSETTGGKGGLAEFREVTRRVFSISADAASHEEIRARIVSGGQVTGTNMVVMVCAILIASAGLNTNSTAVIIGAMLISPLMGSILAIAYGTSAADYKMVRKHLTGFIFQIIFSLLTSTLYFWLSPIKATTSELAARTSPTVFDIVIASAGGIAGIIGQTRQEKANNIVPGVAIATALMPPLCTCGYSIANAKWNMLAGAAYLFLINCYFIYLSACIVLSLLEIPKVTKLTEAEWRRMRFRMVRNSILIALPTILVAIHMKNW
ncbi:MAG: DUF389 domain-containing protein [Eubacteriales bacterium]|jgi:uncharacterized hydrophobic protein (TIGR00271 family)